MSGIKDYDRYDALELARLIRSRELAAVEVLDEAIARAERVNPRLNAIVAKSYDEARAQARRPLPDTALAGVPFLIKDITYQTGLRCSFGSRTNFAIQILHLNFYRLFTRVDKYPFFNSHRFIDRWKQGTA